MAYLRLSDAGASTTSLPIVIQDLGYHASTYNQLLIICTDGQRKYVSSGGGGPAGSYYTTPATFTGLSPGASYGFRVEAIYLAGGRVVPIPDSGWTYFSTESDTQITVGSIASITRSNVTINSFTISWSGAANATSYNLQYRELGSTSWTNLYTSNSFLTISSLVANTYYEYRVRGYTGSTYGPFTDVYAVRTEQVRPTPLNWPTFYSGNSFTLSAVQWNNLNSKINAWRSAKGYGAVTLPAAYSGNVFYATIFNAAVDQLNALSTPVSAPAKVGSAEIITAAKVNRLGSAIDSL